MIRAVVVLFALAFVHPVLAQTAPPATVKLQAAKPASAKPAPMKPNTGANSAATDTSQHGPCIGVIPHIGDRMEVQNIGLTVFNNTFSEVPIESWGLDDLVVARVRAAVGTRFAVRRIPYGNSAFDPYDHPPSTLFRIAANDLKGVVQAVTRGSGCVRYVVVVKGVSVYGDTHSMLKGMGVVNRGNPLFGNKTFLYALSAISVFDGHTFEALQNGAGTSGEDIATRLLGMNPVHGPSRELKDFPWPPPPEKLTSLRDQVRALLAESLDKALPEMLAK
ncbi:MAG TPA: hypothetical protein VH206_16895 [Xanthobacteraceae bacterium]|nr:hypothetical protein [Xanthobacteraceae bacterium]